MTTTQDVAPSLGLWESFISNRSSKLASDPDSASSELEAFIASSRERFTAGLPFNALAKAFPTAFSAFVVKTLALRKQHGSDWDQVFAYYQDRDAAFRQMFSGVSTQNPALISSVHEALSVDADALAKRNRDFCKSLSALLAARTLIEKSAYLTFMGSLKEANNPKPISATAAPGPKPGVPEWYPFGLVFLFAFLGFMFRNDLHQAYREWNHEWIELLSRWLPR
jgi:hypothetical protein